MKQSHVIELFILAAIWGASFLFMRIAAPEFGPILLMTLRVAIASMCLIPVLIYYRQCHELKGNWHHLFVVGLISTALPFSLFGYATLSLTAGVTSVLNTMTPMFGVLIAFCWFKEKITVTMVLGLVLGVFGIYLLMYEKIQIQQQNQVLLPTLAIVTATFCYAFSANYTKKYLTGVKPLVQAAGSLFCATVILLPFSLFHLPKAPISTQSIVAVTLLGVLCTGIAYILFFRLLSTIGPSKTISVTYLIPIFGIFWGYLWLDEHISLLMMMGVSIVLFGVAMSTGYIKKLPLIKAKL